MPIIHKLAAADKSVSGQDKAKHYDWAPIVGEPPEFAMIDKMDLYRDSGYQRNHTDVSLTNHQLTIAKNWNWRDCGAIVCARRNGKVMVIDGQNRVMAAMRRGEISVLPCVLVTTTGSDVNRRSEEAASFLALNGTRRNVTANQRFRSGIIARDASALATDSVVRSAGLTVTIGGNKRGTVSFVNEIRKSIVRLGPDETLYILRVCSSMPSEKSVSVRLFRAVQHIRATNPQGRDFDDLFWSLLAKMPAEVADVSMSRHSASCGMTSPRIWANGIIVEINKSVRNKYSMFEV